MLCPRGVLEEQNSIGWGWGVCVLDGGGVWGLGGFHMLFVHVPRATAFVSDNHNCYGRPFSSFRMKANKSGTVPRKNNMDYEKALNLKQEGKK